MSSLSTIPLFDRLSGARNVLVAGAGGGFDVYAGLPIALALEAQGKTVHLANLSFTDLDGTDALIGPGLARVGPASSGSDAYFPERTLARWRLGREEDADVYAFVWEGVVPMRRSYRRLARDLALDAVVLVDGGTDILMAGEEAGLGTPWEDMTSLAALRGLEEIPIRLVAAIGFGIDAFHGVNHSDVLESIAALTRAGAYLGAFSVPPDSAEAAAYLDAVAHAQLHTPTRKSIVHGQVAAAVSGGFGDVQFTDRTSGSELFVNPLMALYFTFELDGLAASIRYLDQLEGTQTSQQVHRAIETYRASVQPRPRRVFPH